MKKGITIIFLLLSISLVNAAIMHPAGNVSIKVDGTDRNVQYAYDNGLLKGLSIYATVASIIIQHNASQILVSVKDGEMTLIQALNSTNKMCPKLSKPLTYSKSAPDPGHYATEILLSNGKTLQQAINDNDLCITYSWITSSWSSNGACPITTFTRSVNCQRSDGASSGTTCGTYPGCDCPTPASSTTTNCLWGGKTSVQCGCMNIFPGSTSLCTGMQDCSKVGQSCSTITSEYCAEGTCSCGSTCSSKSVYRITCATVSP